MFIMQIVRVQCVTSVFVNGKAGIFKADVERCSVSADAAYTLYL